MDWFKGKSTGNHRFSHQIWGFPVKCPLNQSIELQFLGEISAFSKYVHSKWHGDVDEIWQLEQFGRVVGSALRWSGGWSLGLELRSMRSSLICSSFGARHPMLVYGGFHKWGYPKMDGL